VNGGQIDSWPLSPNWSERTISFLCSCKKLPFIILQRKEMKIWVVDPEVGGYLVWQSLPKKRQERR